MARGSDIETLCRNLIEQLGGELNWKWDERFDTALAEFEVADSERFHALLADHVGTVWDYSTIDSAPDIVRRLCSQFGNLMPGQLLFASDDDSGNVLFCAWWPWGNGVKVSIRVAPYQSDTSASSGDRRSSLLKRFFSI